MEQTEVVIVGAGPTGLTLAAELFRHGVSFILLEKNIKTTHLSKAVVVQARSLEIFDELGLAEKAVNEGRPATAFNIFHKGRKKIHLDISGLGEGLSKYPFALSLEQSKTEKLLVDYLKEKGKDVHWNCSFDRFEELPDGVLVYYKKSNGEMQTIKAGFLVGCDGAHSEVREQMGQSFEGDTVPKIFYVADVRIHSTVINKDELCAFLVKKGFVLFFPMEGEGHYRVIGILPDHTDDDSIDFKLISEDVKQKIMVPLEFLDLYWFSTYKVHSRRASSFRKGRCFIAGDAGHIHTPAGGMGMNTGIQDSYNLAWKLAFVIKHGGNAEILLESYNRERTANAARLLRTTDRMFEILTGASRFWDFVRIHIFPMAVGFFLRKKFFNKRVFPLISMTGISYPGSPLTITSRIGKVRAGDRMPYFEFRDGKNIYDFLMDPAFKMLYFSKDGEPDFSKINTGGFPTKFLVFKEIPDILKGHDKIYILVRPDNHIMYMGSKLTNAALLRLTELSSTRQPSMVSTA